MSRRTVSLILILLLYAAVIWINLPNNTGIQIGDAVRKVDLVLGLDLRGGLQVLLEVPEGTPVTSQNLSDARQILENRSNGLGVSEVVFQIAGERRIVGEFPGLKNTDEVINVIKQTGQMEFVDVGSNYMDPGTTLKTDLGADGQLTKAASPTTAATPASSATLASPTVAAPANSAAAPATGPTPDPKDQVYKTVMTGKDLKAVGVTTGKLNQFVVSFELSAEGTTIFGDHTKANVGKYLAIVLDKKVISCPVINSAITEGSGVIEGNFTRESANNLAVQLRYGSLPVALKIVESRIVGPTLGQDSIRKSILAGIIGLIIIILFMAIFYRLPGVIADLALIFYALITLSLFRLIPVTLTLPGIAGFVLGIGVAVDANILIFERMKEELRSGRTLQQAIDLGWKRAWPSIRDSNISTLITCVILFWFGSAFGASMVKGFAVTLSLGVLVSLFTAIIVTRTFLHTVLDNLKFTEHPKWFGVR